MKKAFIFTGDQNQYREFIRENNLNPREYPRLTETNWRGTEGVDLIRAGTYYKDDILMRLLPMIENYLNERKIR